jgi:type III pantothenate kinase
MSTLLIDAGNTRIKWARLRAAKRGPVRALAWSARNINHLAKQVLGDGDQWQQVLVASVAGVAVNAALRRAASAAGAPAPTFMHSTSQLAGVTNAYRVPAHLGVDRWLAMIGARAQWPRQALCIVSIGTAITVDVLDSRGRHRGGWIIPGPRLMVDALLARTALIRQRANAPSARGARGAAARAAAGLWARDTRSAIEMGALQASDAVVSHAHREAARLLKQPVLLVLSGGGASASANARGRASAAANSIHAPQMVLDGLAVLAAQRRR